MFNELLDEAGLSKGRLAYLLGLSRSTVFSWKGDAPRYVIAYLECLIEVKSIKEH